MGGTWPLRTPVAQQPSYWFNVYILSGLVVPYQRCDLRHVRPNLEIRISQTSPVRTGGFILAWADLRPLPTPDAWSPDSNKRTTSPRVCDPLSGGHRGRYWSDFNGNLGGSRVQSCLSPRRRNKSYQDRTWRKAGYRWRNIPQCAMHKPAEPAVNANEFPILRGTGQNKLSLWIYSGISWHNQAQVSEDLPYQVLHDIILKQPPNRGRFSQLQDQGTLLYLIPSIEGVSP